MITNLKFTGFIFVVFLCFSHSGYSLFYIYADIHTEAVQAALAKHKEEKMALPMPTKRRSAFVQSPIDTCTPPGKLGSTHSEIRWLLVIVAPNNPLTKTLKVIEF